MNKRVTKLLYQYAAIAETDIKTLKKWWNTLNWKERTKERQRIEEELGLAETETTEEESNS